MTALWGTLVNVAAVLAGSGIGLLLRRGIPQRVTDALMVAVGLCTVYIGIDGCLQGEQILVTVVSLAIGAVIGELLNIDGALKRLGEAAERRLTSGGDGTVAKAFVNASLLFCVGSMTVVGSLQSGLTGNHELLYLKSLLDLISSVVFAATLGWGVLLSTATVLTVQGGIALAAQALAPVLTETVVAEMTCVGSLLIVALGLNLLKISQIKIANFLPAIVLPMGLCPLMALIA